jgi:pimeloyl-ACP methyl ester carboxylesterase
VLEPQRIWYLISAVVVAALVFSWMRQSARPAPSEPVAIVATSDGTTGKTETLTRSQCLALPNRVWVALEDGAECIAYIASDTRAGGSTAVLFFEGDVPEADLVPGRMGMIVAAYQQHVTTAQSQYGLPFIVVGRPGVMGSSGFHQIGGLRDEGEVMNIAVDAIKERHGFYRLALAGQSGGARIVAQLLVLGRRDIACAVMASGAYGVPLARGGGHIRTNIFGEPGRRYLVPLHHAERISVAPERRAFVVGDPRDVRTPFPGQREWADKVKALGHHAVVLEGAARDPEHHGLSTTALHVAALCAGGKSDQEIADKVAADRQLGR